MDKEMIRFHTEAAWRALCCARSWHGNPEAQDALADAAEYLEALRELLGGEEADGPTMDNFLNRADALRYASGMEAHREDFDLVFEGIARLQPVFAKSNIDIQNVEEVFNAFEMAQILDVMGGISKKKLGKLRRAITNVIFYTLDESFSAKIPRDYPVILPPYTKFGELIKSITKSGHSVDIITFNYDINLELLFYLSGYPSIEYHLQTVKDKRGAISVFKLHGSMNWMKCNSCRTVFDVEIGHTVSEFRHRMFVVEHALPVPIRFILPEDLRCARCGADGSFERFIVPPSWAKTAHYSKLKSVWRAAAQSLKEAKYISIIGYSFPEADYFFRYLFALGTEGETRIERIDLVDPMAEVLCDRYASFLGPTTRRVFRGYAKGFGAAVEEAPGFAMDLASELRASFKPAGWSSGESEFFRLD